jgi:hypothetical protein
MSGYSWAPGSSPAVDGRIAWGARAVKKAEDKKRPKRYKLPKLVKYDQLDRLLVTGDQSRRNSAIGTETRTALGGK